MKRNIFENYIAPVLEFIGIIGAVVSSIAYVILVYIMVKGVPSIKSVTQTAIYAGINGVMGFLILQCLKLQGTSFAKNLPENRTLVKQYYGEKTKDKKAHSLKYYWATSVVKDLFTKVLTFAFAVFGITYIGFTGNGNSALIGLAFVNILMFLSFGLVGLIKSYEYYNNSFVPYMKDQIEQIGQKVQIDDNKQLNNEKQGEQCTALILYNGGVNDETKR